jgi:hypothetical protein
VLVGGKTVLDKPVSPAAAEPLDVSADLGGAEEVTIEVSFDRQVRLPCAVVLGDAHVVVR